MVAVGVEVFDDEWIKDVFGDAGGGREGWKNGTLVSGIMVSNRLFNGWPLVFIMEENECQSSREAVVIGLDVHNPPMRKAGLVQARLKHFGAERKISGGVGSGKSAAKNRGIEWRMKAMSAAGGMVCPPPATRKRLVPVVHTGCFSEDGVVVVVQWLVEETLEEVSVEVAHQTSKSVGWMEVNGKLGDGTKFAGGFDGGGEGGKQERDSSCRFDTSEDEVMRRRGGGGEDGESGRWRGGSLGG